ncbi:Putative DNA repair helicase RadD, partial [Durusdinium trenchii]
PITYDAAEQLAGEPVNPSALLSSCFDWAGDDQQRWIDLAIVSLRTVCEFPFPGLALAMGLADRRRSHELYLAAAGRVRRGINPDFGGSEEGGDDAEEAHILKLAMGGRCEYCGTREIETLEFHHLEPREWIAANLSRWQRQNAYEREFIEGKLKLGLTTGRVQRPRRFMVYGEGGIGKTSFCAGWPGVSPDAVFVQTELGGDDIGAARFPVASSYGEFTGRLNQLLTEQHEFERVAIDSLDWLEPLVWAEVIRRRPATEKGRPVNSIEDYGYGKGFVYAMDVWRELRSWFDALFSRRNLTIGLIAHYKIEQFKDPTCEPYDRYRPKLRPEAAEMWHEWCDEVFLARTPVATAKADAGFNKEIARGVSTGGPKLFTTEKPRADAGVIDLGPVMDSAGFDSRTGGNLPGLTALQGILFAMGRNLAHLEESLAVAEESPSADVSSNVHESWTAERARGMLDLWLVPGADPSKAAAEVAEKFTEGDISLTFAYLLTAATDPESQPARQLTLLAVLLMAELDFDPQQQEDASFGNIPAGEYAFIAEKEELKNSQANPSNRYIAVQFSILEGPHAGRKIFGNFNMWNSNETAQRLGRAEFKSLCQAVGVPSPKNTVEILNRPFYATVKHEKRRDTGELQDRLDPSSYRSITSQASGTPSASPPAAPFAAQPATAAPQPVNTAPAPQPAPVAPAAPAAPVANAPAAVRLAGLLPSTSPGSVMELRYYQSGAVNAAYDWLRTRSGAPLIVIPTGGGKTPVIASMCRDAVDLWGGRVMVLAHVKELIEQAAEEIRGMAPGLDVGLYSAGARRADTGNAVVCAGIQSVWGKAHEFGRRDLVLIDEAHLIPPEGDGMYRTFLSDLRKTSPHFRFAGLTATPYRLTSGLIYGGPEDHFEGICYE